MEKGENLSSPESQSPPRMVPLRMLHPGFHGSDDRQLSVVTTPTTGVSRFGLPEGWEVKAVIRPDGRKDKQYYEQNTGKMLRSMKEVERYINGEYTPRRRGPRHGTQHRSTKEVERYIDGEDSTPRRKAPRLGNQPRPAVVTSISTCTALPNTIRSRLPSDWTVKLVLRSDGVRVDKYYFDPSTGKMFRSVNEVERYIYGEECTSQQKAPRLGFGSAKMIASGGKLLKTENEEFGQWPVAVVNPNTVASTSNFSLPDGWVVEEVPRRCHGWTDKYYYEPGTGRKFRSLVSVARYLQGGNPWSQAFKMGIRGKSYASQKNTKWGALTSDSIEPPEKINWVLADSGGLTWNPFMRESLVPNPVKNQWVFKFMQLTRNRYSAAPDIKCEVTDP